MRAPRNSIARNTTTLDRHRRDVEAGKGIQACHRPDCYWCGEPIDYYADHLDPLSFQIDHVLPRSRGGPDTLDNIVASHRKCNRAKGDKLIYRPGVTYVTDRDWWSART